MTSTESKYLADIYAEWLGRMTAEPEMQLPAMRDLFEEWHLVTGEPTEVTYAEVDADGVPSVWCVPLGCATDRVVLYTHGGGFVVGSRHTHRKLAGHLAKAIGCRALVVDYRRAPEHPFPAQLDDSVRAYRWLLAQGIEPGHIATAGDSAGGNLAISVALKLRDDGDPLPAALLPMSPWLDMEHKGETLESNAATDALVQRPILEGMSTMFLGADGSATDPLANPLYADPAGLPPIFMNVGGHETLLDNAQRFEAMAKRAGVEVRLDVADGMQHVYPFLAGRAPEGDKAVNDMAAWVRPKLGLS
ncbi:MAG: alpha/beta hydrolase [Pseudonocardia sp.]|jgi:epsilon-lactone hydrolase